MLSGRFVDQDPEDANEHPIQACFIKERQDIVNAHRDPEHPAITHEDIVDFWYELNEGADGAEEGRR